MIVVMTGVSGAGKTLISRRLAAALGWRYVEGDDFHSPVNKAKMSAGYPLSDTDRWPWLHAIRDRINELDALDQNAVVACSALKPRYRRILRTPSVRFCVLRAPRATLVARIQSRDEHFMPASQIDDQLEEFDALTDSELAAGDVRVDATGTPGAVTARVIEALGLDVQHDKR